MLSVLFESVSTQARDFVIGAPARDVRFGGSFLARGPWTGQIWRDGVIVDRFIARYDAAYEQPATLASLAAAYAGSMGSSRGSQAAVVTVSATGNIAGTAAGCAFQGSVAPHGDVGVYEVALTLSGGLCPFLETATGIAYFDPTTRTIYVAVPNAARSDALVFWAVR